MSKLNQTAINHSIFPRLSVDKDRYGLYGAFTISEFQKHFCSPYQVIVDGSAPTGPQGTIPCQGSPPCVEGLLTRSTIRVLPKLSPLWLLNITWTDLSVDILVGKCHHSSLTSIQSANSTSNEGDGLVDHTNVSTYFISNTLRRLKIC